MKVRLKCMKVSVTKPTILQYAGIKWFYKTPTLQVSTFTGKSEQAMLEDLRKRFPFVIQGGQVCHLDTVSKAAKAGLHYGYKTTFLQILMEKRGEVTKTQKQLLLFCGGIAYSEVLPCFEHLLGVTGTLSCMTPQQVRYCIIYIYIHICIYAWHVHSAGEKRALYIYIYIYIYMLDMGIDEGLWARTWSKCNLLFYLHQYHEIILHFVYTILIYTNITKVAWDVTLWFCVWFWCNRKEYNDACWAYDFLFDCMLL